MKINTGESVDSKAVADYLSKGGETIHLGDEIQPLVAEYGRDGTDLTLTGDSGEYITIHDYFASFPGADLITAGGARIPSDLVSRLAGPGPQAQTQTIQSDANGPIGEVTELSGNVHAKHPDGTSDDLVQGASVFQGDILETASGSSFTVIFVDDTQFSMGENGRAVLDEMIYSPSTGSGSFGISLLQGVFSLVSGQIAKDNHDNVDIRTPVGTIGIRGTSWAGNIKSIGEESIFTLFTGAIIVTNEAGSQVLDTANQSVIVTSYSSLPSVPFIVTGEQLFDIYGEALRLINPDWFDDEKNFDPDKIAPEAGGRRASNGGGAGFQAFSEGGIDGGAAIGNLLKPAGLLDPTNLHFDQQESREEVTGAGPQTSLNVNAIIDPESGNVNVFQVVVSLNAVLNVPVTITYQIRSGSATETDTGLPGDVDFVGGGNGTLVIPAGETSAGFTINVTDDAVIENQEFFIVALTGADNADINVAFSQAVIIINDDDIGIVSLGEVTAGNVFLSGDVGVITEDAGTLTYQLILDKAVAPGVTVSVDYVLTGTATAESDYAADAVRTATFNGGVAGLAPGATVTVSIPIIDDNLYEGAESLTLTLVGGSSNSSIDASSGSFTVMIEDNDIPIVLDNSPVVDLDEGSPGNIVDDGSLGIAGGSGTIAAITFNTEQADFDAAGLTSNGAPVVLNGLGTNTLTGMADGQPVFTILLNADGTYDLTLNGPVDHIGSTGENVPALDFDLAFVVNDVNGSSAAGTFQIDISDNAPSAGLATNVIVDEDDLPGGSDTTPDGTTVTGTVTPDFGLDGPGGVTLDISSLPELTSRGDPVDYSIATLDDGITQRVTAMALPEEGAPRTVFVLDLAPAGTGDSYGYSLTLIDAIDHGASGQDAQILNFGYTVEDYDGSVAHGSFTATIVDDVPIASPDSLTLQVPELPAYDLVFVLDTSGSMDELVPGNNGATRIDVLKQAVTNVLDEYQEASRAVNITLISFASAASVVYEGTSVAEAQAFINNQGNLTTGGLTNYAAAVADTPNGAQGILETHLADATLTDYSKITYFISDGSPSGASSAVPTANGNAWQDFVDSNHIEVIAVGLGSGINTAQLAKVENFGDDPTLILNPNDLEGFLVTSVPVVETDNVVSYGTVDQLGADGGTLTTLIYNGASHDIPQNGASLTLDTVLGGSIVIDSSGNYTYTAPPTVDPGVQESFEYVLTDGDGDTSSAILSFTFVENIAGSVIAFSSFAAFSSTIDGTDGNEHLLGTGADELILGFGGNDILQGNGGNDVLQGGDGADSFVFNGADSGNVIIADFSPAEDTVNLDQLFDDLGILADARAEGDAWHLSELDGKAAISFVAANAPTIVFDNYANPDIQALNDIAAKIVVDES
ncbi:Calx-beta domain-containing protein [Sneathiella sp.]|uniref:T1SS-143 repeat domain-containing protein n=1 Tax=Sneathiella sp. TaxID=1964365 RepID=UPI0035631BF5